MKRTMKLIRATISAFLSLAVTATLVSAVDYSAWKHSGSMFIITTPEGANLPGSASETNFPLLVRLNRGNFAFAQAQNDGRDIRFAIQGTGTVPQPATVLPHQIEQWDATNELAAIWVKIPSIVGNARQEIKMYWGNAAAASESSGTAVFNADNGYAAVLHMNETVEDSVGTLKPTNVKTTVSNGVIGKSRSFTKGQGVNCGKNDITTFPTGATPHSSQIWLKAEELGVNAMSWGQQKNQSQMRMTLEGPSPHVNVDGYWANIKGNATWPLTQWVHIAHTYDGKQAKLYINGVLDHTAACTFNIPTPVSMSLGGKWTDYDFSGEIDEVRISKTARSDHWIKMEYENQKTLQTMVGGLIPTGPSTLTVTPATVTMNEGASNTLTVKTGGVQKSYWLRVENGVETPYAVDQLSLDFPAGRIAGNQSYSLRFKGIYPTEIKTVDIPITAKEFIPDPVFTLTAPATWNGRDTITVTPNITNLEILKAKDATKFTYSWRFAGVAETKSIAPGVVTLLRSQGSGTLTVTLTMDNGGTPVTNRVTITVKEPATDPWAQRTPEATEKAVNNQFYARDNTGQGKIYYNGTITGSPTSVFLKIYTTDTGTDVLYKAYTQAPGAGGTYAFTAPIAAGKVTYKAVFGSTAGGVDTIKETVTDLVCGDAYIIDGQSNAVAWSGMPRETSTDPWVRTYDIKDGWCLAIRSGGKGAIGYWGKDMGLRLSSTYNMPICILNGAKGGTRIDEHQAHPTKRLDYNTLYGALLTRVTAAKLTHGIRAMLWHQGENDQGTGGPGGDFGWKTYRQYFVDMTAAWKQDCPNLSHYYIFQITPFSCGMGPAGDQLREVQRTLPAMFSKMRIMSTVGSIGNDGCHYSAEGWKQMYMLMSPLLEQDFYGLVPKSAITAPNVKKAYFTTAAKNEIALEFGQNMEWNKNQNSKKLFFLDGVMGAVATGSASGNVIKLQLTAASTASTITYIQDPTWDKILADLVYGSNGIAALTFSQIPIESAPTR